MYDRVRNAITTAHQLFKQKRRQLIVASILSTTLVSMGATAFAYEIIEHNHGPHRHLVEQNCQGDRVANDGRKDGTTLYTYLTYDHIYAHRYDAYGNYTGEYLYRELERGYEMVMGPPCGT